ncbi:LysR family transcriptional regulator [Leisingera sp. XS_AS12]|uniref:LysR family transcriptional regulator n=1 Tax=Leisingera sp. XS_AS12 TaxID=3241294 RepID=UPI003513715A
MSDKAKRPGLPPLDWLRVFEAAGRHGNFTAAAEELGTSQAAVSQRIRNLETWLGRPLFLRMARGVTLTVEGESYLPLVQDTLLALAQGTRNLFDHSFRELRIAALPGHLELLVMPRLRELSTVDPGVRLVTETVPKRLEFDAAEDAVHIRYGRGKWERRDAALLGNEVLRPMVAPQVLADWKDLPVIELRGERPGWAEWARVTGEDEPAAASISVDSMSHALELARLGQGVVLGSCVLAWKLLQAEQLCCVPAPQLAVVDGYWLTWPPSLATSRRQSRLLEALVAALTP